MRGKPVDLGPMAMPVGEVAGQGLPPLSDERASDLQRLSCLLADSRGDQERAFVPDTEPPEGASGLAGSEAGEAEVLVKLGEALPALVKCCKQGGTQTVCLRLQGDLLPESTLTVFESGSRLQFEIRVADISSRRWLGYRLPWLARAVGTRLGRPLRIVLLDPCRQSGPEVQMEWPEGGAA